MLSILDIYSYKQNRIKMTEAEFINQISNEMSGSGMLPVILEESEIKRIADYAAEFFYDNYNYAVEQFNYIVEQSYFETTEFIKSRFVKLPECVISVTMVREMNGIGRLGNMDRDFSIDKMMAAGIFLNSTQGDDLVMRVSQAQYYDLSKAFYIDTIAHKYNKNTHRLAILGRDPRTDVHIQVYIKIPMDALYEDIYFKRYVVGKCKVQLGRLLSMFPFQLPGNVQINTDKIEASGKEEVDEILKRIEEENVPDFLYLFN